MSSHSLTVGSVHKLPLPMSNNPTQDSVHLSNTNPTVASATTDKGTLTITALGPGQTVITTSVITAFDPLGEIVEHTVLVT